MMLVAETQMVGAPGSWRARLRQLEDQLAQVFITAATLALVTMVALNGVNVVCRYVFSSPLSWTDEAMMFLMTIAVFLGAIAATRQALHIRIDLFVDRLPRPQQRLVSAVALVASIAILVALSVTSVKVVQMLASFDQRSDAMEIPIWIIQALVPLSLLTSAALLAARLVTGLLDASTDTPKKD